MFIRSILCGAVLAVGLSGDVFAQTRKQCTHEGRSYGKDCQICIPKGNPTTGGNWHICREISGKMQWQKFGTTYCNPKSARPQCR